jgi:hypothetical protein
MLEMVNHALRFSVWVKPFDARALGPGAIGGMDDAGFDPKRNPNDH